MDMTLLSCEGCMKDFISPQYMCPHCYSEELVETKVSGRGRIYSYTTIYAAPERLAAEAPYHVILVDLDEGLRVTARLVEGEPCINQEVKLCKKEDSIYWFEQINN
ncbi:Zn-ribbon domain-containing OB-fold protein [Metabacillus sediminilitoris]|uniref:ChsH2 C-terminal OB-fold domain-containing protein n=1 Tax=Metabacillus sediminilitoris TaxID=2567941 RepID=A0A4S4BP42_9BACI|nr:OB-fold domain-containing protein [Metabacillus sediminilitoris]QGQ45563.1 hypothetical protein GMB29_10070 [Metabacillus sediminilitoris]THF76627.1 hypothetical protein E6W99_21005 [Metabacillus sediminilitoris]